MTDYTALIASMVRDEQSRLSEGDADTALQLALLRYGTLRPVRDGAGAVVATTPSSVPAADVEAVCCYAASLLLTQLSAAAMNDSDSTITADSVNRQSKADGYARRAKELLARFDALMGLSGAGGSNAGGQPLPAGGVVSFAGRPRTRTRWPAGG